MRKRKKKSRYSKSAPRSVGRSWKLPLIQPWMRFWDRWSPPTLYPFLPRRDGIGLGLLFIGILVLYGISTPSTVMMEDDGLFITTAKFLGVAHPPGYPAYVLMSWLATHFPLGSMAWRVHMFSGLMGAVTCICIAWIVLRRTDRPLAAYLAGGGLAVSDNFWSQAIIADVYTTNTAILFLILGLLQEATARRDGRLWIAAAATVGIGLANHWPLLLLGSPVLLFYALVAKGDFWKRIIYLIPITLLVAAALYGWMVWRTHQSIVINFLGPIQTWDAFTAYVGRSIYSGVDTRPSADWSDKIQYARYLAIQCWLEFGPPGALIAVWGVFVGYLRGWRLGTIGETLAFVGSSLGLIATLGFNYEYLELAVFRPYPLVAYCIFALWFGYGLAAIATALSDHRPTLRRLLWGGTALSVAAIGGWNAKINYRTDDTFAADQAQVMLDLMEPDSVLVVYADLDTPQVTYLHLVEGKRPDIRLLNSRGLLLNDRIVHPLWSQTKKNEAWNEFLSNTRRPVYFSSANPFTHFGHNHYGYIKQADHDLKSSAIRVVENSLSKGFFKRLIATPDSGDRWVDYRRNILLHTYGSYVGLMLLFRNFELSDYIAEIMPLVENNYWSLFGMINTIFRNSGDQHLSFIVDRLQKVKQLAKDDRNKRELASLYYMDGFVHQKQGRTEQAREWYQKSAGIYKVPGNPANAALKNLPPPATE